ncbi:hypothetical protein POM88_049882 [Heracleum sosnowskyi]|uniref:Uncharacterized protein n=1 Tax=Heracleum sosnowskyi TaxID=360622 RepID=A0AAD8M0Y6_9APIA|nr:hypothetical protein POM88_049882 [Heracleum sosnowskyi]
MSTGERSNSPYQYVKNSTPSFIITISSHSSGKIIYRSCSSSTIESLTTLPRVNVLGGSVHGSSVSKCLFNQPSKLPPNDSSCPNTPPQEMSTPIEIIASPQETANAIY